MASPASTAAAEALENFISSIVVSSSQRWEGSVDEDNDTTPPSPDIGMGSPMESDTADVGLKDEGRQHAADKDVFDTPIIHRQDHDGATNVKNGRVVRVLASSYQTQQLSQKVAQSCESNQVTTPAPTYPPIRRSARAKSALVYDQKYHPLDDIIRPSQAAKRRLLHGEQHVLGSGSDCRVSEASSSDFASKFEDQDEDSEESPPSKKGCKRMRLKSSTPEPTRRSSRKRLKLKVSYNMRIHPQDSDLQRAWACDGSKSSPSPTEIANPTNSISSSKRSVPDDLEEICRSLPVGDSEDCPSGPAPVPFVKRSAQIVSVLNSALEQDAITLNTYPDVRPRVVCLSAGRNEWPIVKQLPFQIFTERIEDQLNAEAESASPFHYEGDDKENDITNPELVTRPNPLDGISIIPASQYRRGPELYNIFRNTSTASNAFYVHPDLESTPYGLGWSDGAHDEHNSETNSCPFPDYIRILASSEHPPRASPPTESSYSRGGNDTVSFSSTGGRKIPEHFR